MCGCEFNVAGAGGTIAGAVHGHFSSRSDISAIYHSAVSLTMMIVEIVHNCRQFCDILNRQFDLNLENDLDMMAAHLLIVNLMLERRLTKRNIS